MEDTKLTLDMNWNETFRLRAYHNVFNTAVGLYCIWDQRFVFTLIIASLLLLSYYCIFTLIIFTLIICII